MNKVKTRLPVPITLNNCSVVDLLYVRVRYCFKYECFIAWVFPLNSTVRVLNVMTGGQFYRHGRYKQ
jgi:hypothetical protein